MNPTLLRRKPIHVVIPGRSRRGRPTGQPPLATQVTIALSALRPPRQILGSKILRPVDVVTFKMPLQHYNQIVKQHSQPQPATGGNHEVYQSAKLPSIPKTTRKKIFFDPGGPNLPQVRCPSLTIPLYPPAPAAMHAAEARAASAPPRDGTSTRDLDVPRFHLRSFSKSPLAPTLSRREMGDSPVAAPWPLARVRVPCTPEKTDRAPWNTGGQATCR